MHLASQRGHVDIVDVLLSHNAFVNAKTKLGLTPLHLGAQSGSAHLVSLLVTKHQASIDALSLVSVVVTGMGLSFSISPSQSLPLTLFSTFSFSPPSLMSPSLFQSKQTPLHLAAVCGHLEVCSRLLQLGADITASDIVSLLR